MAENKANTISISGGAMENKGSYNTEIKIQKNIPIDFFDFTLTYLGSSVKKHPTHDFLITDGKKKKKITFGTKFPLEFKAEGNIYCLEMNLSYVCGKDGAPVQLPSDTIVVSFKDTFNIFYRMAQHPNELEKLLKTIPKSVSLFINQDSGHGGWMRNYSIYTSEYDPPSVQLHVQKDNPSPGETNFKPQKFSSNIYKSPEGVHDFLNALVLKFQIAELRDLKADQPLLHPTFHLMNLRYSNDYEKKWEYSIESDHYLDKDRKAIVEYFDTFFDWSWRAKSIHSLWKGEPLEFPDIFKEIPSDLKVKAKIIVAGIYQVSRGPCVFYPGGRSRIPLLSGFKVAELYKGVVGTDYIGISHLEAPLPPSVAPSSELQEGKLYLLLLNPNEENQKKIKTGEGNTSYLNTLSKEEILVLKLYEPGVIIKTTEMVTPSPSSIRNENDQPVLSKIKKISGNGFEFQIPEFEGWGIGPVLRLDKIKTKILFNAPDDLELMAWNDSTGHQEKKVHPQLTIYEKLDRTKESSQIEKNSFGVEYSTESSNAYFFRDAKTAVGVIPNFTHVSGLERIGFDLKNFFDRMTQSFRWTDKDLVFAGTVSEIKASPLEHSELNYFVTTKVDQIFQGKLSSSTFSFRVHSPSRAGLEIGKSYGIRAQAGGTGYIVDEFQWEGGKELRIEDLLSVDDIEAIRTVTIDYLLRSNHKHKQTFIDELKQDGISVSDRGISPSGNWVFRTRKKILELVYPIVPPTTIEPKEWFIEYFGVQLEKKKNRWLVKKDFYMTEKWKSE